MTATDLTILLISASALLAATVVLIYEIILRICDEIDYKRRNGR
jgi:hypothetical protein